MEEWKTVKLDDVCEFSKDRISANYLNKYNYIGVENLLSDKKGKIISTCVPTNGNLIKFEKNNILIGNIRPYLKKIWFADISGGANSDVLVIKIKNNNLIPKFIFYVLSSDTFFNYDMQNAKGTKMPRGSKTAIMNFQISVPPIEEQEKIAEILSTQDKLIELKQKLVDRKKQQKKWLMQNLLTGRIRLKGFTDEWKKAKLGDIAIGFDYGMNVPAIEYDGENKYIRITDIDEDSHKYLNTDMVSPNGFLDKKYIVNKNDILLTRTGASTGKSYLYDKNDGKLFFAGFLIRINIQNNNSYFIFSQTLTERYNKWIKIMSVRSGQPGINANEYAMFEVLLPSIKEQTAIAEILSSQDKEIELLEKELEQEKLKKKALMQLLLTGKVRVI